MTSSTTQKTLGAAAIFGVLATGIARLEHAGPFAREVATHAGPLVHSADVVAFSMIGFRDAVNSMREGNFAEKQAVDIACSFFTAMVNDNAPPAEWTDFRTALADRAGVSSSSKFWTTKISQLEVTVDLVQEQPKLAQEYLRYCVL